MKAITLALALLTSAVQTVGWVECCCVLICKHRNDPCKDECKEKDKREAPVVADCCARKAKPPLSHKHEDDKRCSHVEPSSEVLAQATTVPPLVFDLILDLPLLPRLPAPPEGDRLDGASGHPTRGSPPLHLLYSVLLI